MKETLSSIGRRIWNQFAHKLHQELGRDRGVCPDPKPPQLPFDINQVGPGLTVAILLGTLAVCQFIFEGQFRTLGLHATDLPGAPWKLVTQLFIHAGWRHLFSNMVAILAFAPSVLAVAGLPLFFLVFFGGGAVAGLVSVMWNPEGLFIGASPAVYAIMGAAALLTPYGYRNKDGDKGAFPFVLVFAAFYTIGLPGIEHISQATQATGVNFVGHLAGTAWGLLVPMLFVSWIFVLSGGLFWLETLLAEKFVGAMHPWLSGLAHDEMPTPLSEGGWRTWAAPLVYLLLFLLLAVSMWLLAGYVIRRVCRDMSRRTEQ